VYRSVAIAAIIVVGIEAIIMAVITVAMTTIITGAVPDFIGITAPWFGRHIMSMDAVTHAW